MVGDSESTEMIHKSIAMNMKYLYMVHFVEMNAIHKFKKILIRGRITAFYVVLALHMPDQMVPVQVDYSSSTHHFDIGSTFTLYYPQGLFENTYHLEPWLESSARVVVRALSNYSEIVASGLIPECRSGALVQSLPIHVVLMPSLLTSQSGARSSEHLRTGFYHPNNIGPIVRAVPWDGLSVQRAMIHELFHFWCHSEQNPSQDLRWREEGAADYLVYQTTLIVPQFNITNYFRDPLVNGLYGGSFLWWFAYFQSRSHHSRMLDELLRLHLGHRASLFFGQALEQQDPDDALTRARNPFGFLAHREPRLNESERGTTHILPLTRAHFGWGYRTLTPTNFPRIFIWRGPLVESNSTANGQQY